MMTGEQTPSLRVARSCVFSPVNPLFRGRTGRQRRRTGRQQNSLTLILFSPRKPRFHRRCAPLKVSLWRRMSADATGIFILTGTTTGNRLRLFCFLPVNLSFIAAFAALKVSFPGACPGKDGSLISTKRQHPRCAYACSNVFSSCYSFVLKVRFRGAKTNY